MALKAIREQEPDLDDEDLALLIRLRAEDYRKMYPEMPLTPTALAKHWNGRVPRDGECRNEERAQSPADKPPHRCATCGGDKVVVVAFRQSPNPLSPYEEMAPCPDCNPRVISWWPGDGSPQRRTPDPEEVRRMLDE